MGKKDDNGGSNQLGLLVILLVLVIGLGYGKGAGGQSLIPGGKEKKPKAGQKADGGPVGKCRGDREGPGCRVADLVRSGRITFSSQATYDFKVASGLISKPAKYNTYDNGYQDYTVVKPVVWDGLRRMANSLNCKGKPGAVYVRTFITRHYWFTASGNRSDHSAGEAADIYGARYCGEWYDITLSFQRNSKRGYEIMTRLIRACDASGAHECISALDLPGSVSWRDYTGAHNDHLHAGY